MKTEDGKLKFSFMEMVTSGSSGCISATGFLGVTCGLVMLIVFIAMVIYHFINPQSSESTLDIINQATIWFGMASALLGCRKITGMIGNTKSQNKVNISQENGVSVDVSNQSTQEINED